MATDPTHASSSTSTTTPDNAEYSTGTVAHIRLNRAIEIVIDSIQSLEGAVNNFDQLVFSLIYGPLNTRTEVDGTEVNESNAFTFLSTTCFSLGNDPFISNIEFKFSISIKSR